MDQLRAAVLVSMDKGSAYGDLKDAVFVAATHPRAEKGKLGGLPDRLLGVDSKPPSDWAGRLVVIAGNATAGWSRKMSETVEDVFNRLESEGLGSAPVAIVSPSKRSMTLFPYGAESEEGVLRIALPAKTRSVTLKNLIEVIEEVRREGLMSPQVCPPGFWADQHAHAPGDQVERHIQWGVALALRSSFRPIQADIEDITSVGRIDISMLNPSPGLGDPVHPAIVELKALRSCSSNKTPVAPRANILATLSGHKQAAAYRNKRAAPIGLLACFDLRKNKDDILSHPVIVAARAKYFDENLEARIFRVYADNKDALEELAA